MHLMRNCLVIGQFINECIKNSVYVCLTVTSMCNARMSVHHTSAVQPFGAGRSANGRGNYGLRYYIHWQLIKWDRRHENVNILNVCLHFLIGQVRVVCKSSHLPGRDGSICRKNNRPPSIWEGHVAQQNYSESLQKILWIMWRRWRTDG